MNEKKEYGEMMQYLLHFRDSFSSDADFNRFVVESLRAVLYDLRDFDVYISISPDSLKWSRGRPRELSRSTVC
jgi:hypothetical protein